MKIIIDIPKEEFLLIRHYQDIAPNKTHSLAMSIINGIPLPKGHGRLIDDSQIAGDSSWDISDRLDATPTIIEADRSKE